MRIRMQAFRWGAAVLCSLALSLIGVQEPFAFSQQTEKTSSAEPAKTGSDGQPIQEEKKVNESPAKPLTKRPDPRVPASQIKTEPKTERELAQDRKARDAARKNGEITFDDLKFEMEKDAAFQAKMITKEIKELNKKTVKLRGFILPTSVFQQSGIKQFVLVRDNQECCFGPGAAIYDCVIVDMVPGKTTNFATRVVTVKGKLEIDTESFQYPDDGGYYAIYKMTAEEVK